MASYSLWILIHIFLVNSNEISKYIDCYNQKGSEPKGGQSTSTATCDNYNLVSCHFANEFTDIYPPDFSGGEIKTGTACESTTDDGFTRAYARCCNLTDFGSSFQNSNEQNQPVVECKSPNEILLGCSVEGNSAIHGAYVGYLNHSDVSYNRCTSSDEGTWKYAKCYDESTLPVGYHLHCISVWGQWSNVSTASCPRDKENYFMSHCAGYSPNGTMISYVIDKGTCAVSATRDCAANALCCRMTIDLDEINATTAIPTVDPIESTQAQNSPNPTQSLHKLLALYNESAPITFSPLITYNNSTSMIYNETTSPQTSASLFTFSQYVISSTDIVDDYVYHDDTLRIFLIVTGIAVLSCCTMIFICCKCCSRLTKKHGKQVSSYKVDASEISKVIERQRSHQQSPSFYESDESYVADEESKGKEVKDELPIVNTEAVRHDDDVPHTLDVPQNGVDTAPPVESWEKDYIMNIALMEMDNVNEDVVDIDVIYGNAPHITDAFNVVYTTDTQPTL